MNTLGDTIVAYLRRVYLRVTLDRMVLVLVSAAVAGGIGLFVWFLAGNNRIEIVNKRVITVPSSPITGLPCTDPSARPLAVMLASDAVARPLSGIAAAELVIELPVTPDGITRMMAVFLCDQPEEIGSIRSARDNFIGLAMSMEAIYAHWGGERGALTRLNAGILDNLDAMVYEGSVFYRKKGIPPPHNGFTTPERLYEKAEDLGYALTASPSFWPHRSTRPARSLGSAVQSFTISYINGGRVLWTYDDDADMWIRSRNGTPETDALDGRKVRAGVVVVLETDSTFLHDQYISVNLIGSGNASLFQDGVRRSVTWSRTGESDMLSLTDSTGAAVLLAPGPVWIEVITPGIELGY